MTGMPEILPANSKGHPLLLGFRCIKQKLLEVGLLVVDGFEERALPTVVGTLATVPPAS